MLVATARYTVRCSSFDCTAKTDEYLEPQDAIAAAERSGFRRWEYEARNLCPECYNRLVKLVVTFT